MKKLTLFILAISFQLLAISFQAKAQQYKTLYDFSNTSLDPDSPEPNKLITSVTGDTLFGTTYEGGKYGHGSVFYITADGSVYDTLVSLGGIKGEAISAGVVLSGNVLYGVALYGGKYGKGVIFSIHTDGTQYDTLHNFGWGTKDGVSPAGGLTISSTGVLFGTTSAGGAKRDGTIFRINTDGSGYDTLHSFGWFAAGEDGKSPNANLTLSGNMLYGTTLDGGVNNDGIIFSINTDGTGYDTLHNFGNGTDGQSAQGSLLLAGNTLYGMTTFGGTYSIGMAFSIHTDGTQYDTLHNFGWGTTDGINPNGSFTLVNNILYSVTREGGQENQGLLFSINPDGSNYDTLHNFGSGTDGQNPDGDLVYFNGSLFGDGIYGGAAGNGTVFDYHILYPTINITSGITCNGESNGNDSVAVIGGTSPYTYSWSDGSTATVAAANPTGKVLGANTYTLTVTDNTGLSITTSVTVTQPSALAITPSSTPDNGTANGTASVAVSGGTSPYTYSWAPVSASTSSISSLSAGTYTCTVTDANGCGNTATTVTISSSASINEVKGESEKVKVYPNPSNGQFNVVCHSEGSEESPSKIEVYNVLGEQVCTSTPAFPSPAGGGMSSVFQMNLSSQPNGVYLYRVITNSGELIGEGKIIVQK